jgi:alkaline phosphatase D
VSPLDRRAFLAGAAASLAAVQVRAAQRVMAGAAPPLPDPPFTLGVASGDPSPTGSVLWTRLAPDPLNGGGMGPGDVAVDWEVATDIAFADVVDAGTAVAVAELAHSVHVEVDSLDPDSWYYYRFSAGGHDSAIGRTRTLPPAGCTPDDLRFAFTSCQSWPSGLFTAYDHLSREQLDLVLHLGDYIYEGGSGGSPVRPHNSGEVTTLAAYRNRYALYKGDPFLQSAHAAFPWVVTWDDHEVDNNYAGANDQDGTDPAIFLLRRADAYQAWWEHQPVRLPRPTGPDLQIYRSFDWGDLATVFTLDTRQYRTDQGCGDGLVLPCPDLDDPNRTMLGTSQEQWLHDGLRSSTSTWNVMAQQTVMTAMPVATLVNVDQWDGYPLERQRLCDVLAEPGVKNPVVVTGDIHSSGIGDIRSAPESPNVGTEFVGTSISSTFDPALIDAAEAIIGGLEWVHYVNARQRGYVRCLVSPDQWQADYRLLDTALVPGGVVSTATSWVVESDNPQVTPCPVEPEPGPEPGPPPTTTPGSTAPPAEPSPAVAGSSSPASARRTVPSFTG